MRKFFLLVCSSMLLMSLTSHSAEPKNNAEEQAWAAATEANISAGYKAYLTEYPKGRYAATARIKIAILGNNQTTPATVSTAPTALPATPKLAAAPVAASRPTLPFEISDALWQQIAQSDLYRNTPRVHTLEARYTETSTIPITMFKKSITTQQVLQHIAPINNATPALSEGSTQFVSTSNNDMPTVKTGFKTYIMGGLMAIQTLDMDGKLMGQLSRIDTLQGSFYPPRTGNSVSVNYQTKLDGGSTLTIEQTCTLGTQISASSLAPMLKGNAWQVECSNKNTVTGGPYPVPSSSKISHDYLLEDLGVMVSSIGIVDVSKKISVIPIGQPYSFHIDAGSTKIDYLIENYSLSLLD
jgi:hypothetical protein